MVGIEELLDKAKQEKRNLWNNDKSYQFNIGYEDSLDISISALSDVLDGEDMKPIYDSLVEAHKEQMKSYHLYRDYVEGYTKGIKIASDYLRFMLEE